MNDSGWLSGPGRGSAAGCLISYLVGITQIDPLEFDLLFSRFYNAGRNTKDHVSLPDIDMDVPTQHRDDVISYLKEKYGNDRVSQMLTFGRLQGRSALKEVLRVFNACSLLVDAITKRFQMKQRSLTTWQKWMRKIDQSFGGLYLIALRT